MMRRLDRIPSVAAAGLGLRIGLATGQVVAGVIGTRKFSYDVWGDTVNMASRMESTAEAGTIQITEETYRLLRDGYDFERRDAVEVKGKGAMGTYVLLGRRPEGEAVR
jgi:class 3 adenylate cyclase